MAAASNFYERLCQGRVGSRFCREHFFRNPVWQDIYRAISIFRKKVNKLKVASASDLNEKPNGIKLISPQVLPPDGWLFRTLNRYILLPRLIRKLQHHYDVVILYMPSYTTEQLLSKISKGFTVFDYVANFEGHPQKPKDYELTESKILAHTNLVLTDSDYLYQKLRMRHKKVFQIHHGVQTHLFKSYYKTPLKKYSKVCFFGGIDDRIDWESLKTMMNCGYDITMIGPCKVKVPISVRIKPSMNIEELSKEIVQYDAFIIPYLQTTYSDGIIPAKIFECFATGKPVLTSRLVSLEPIADLLYICDQPADYVACMERMPETETRIKIEKRIKLSEMQSSDSNVERYIEIIEQESRQV